MADDVKTGIKLEVEGEDEFNRGLHDAAEAAGDLKKGLEDAADGASESGKKIADELETAALEASAAIGDIIAGVGELSAALIAEVNRTAEYGDAIDKNSQALGISAEAYQEWDYILSRSGSSMKSAESMFRKLANASEYASDKQAAAFETIGLSMDQVQAMNPEQLFESVIRGLQGMEAGAERTAIATTLLGSNADKLGPLLNSSAEDIEAMRQRAHELGVVMSDEDIAAAAAYQDSLEDFNAAIDGAKRQLTEGFMPALTTARGQLAEFIANDVDWDSVNEKIGKLTEKSMELAGYLLEHGDTVAGIITTIGGAWAAWKGTEVVMTLVDNVRSLYGWLDKLGAVMGAGGGTMLGGAAVAALGAYEVLSRIREIGGAGILGDGHELAEYADNVTYYTQKLAEAQRDYDNTALYSPEGLAMAQDALSMAQIALQKAEAEYEAVLALQAQAAQGGEDPAAEAAETQAAVAQTVAETEKQVAESSGRMLETIDATAGEIGTTFRQGTDEMSQAAAESIEGANNVLSENMGTLSANAAIWGEDMMISLANGIITGYNSWVLPAIGDVAGGIEAMIGFSEPEVGPLSKFHTFAPDMMALFAKGIRDNKWMIDAAATSSFDLAPYLESSGGRTGTNLNYGGVNVTFEVKDGQTGRELYEEFSYYLREDLARERAVFGR